MEKKFTFDGYTVQAKTWKELFAESNGIGYIDGRAKLKTTMSRVAEDKHGRYLPAKLIGSILSPRGKK